MISFLGRKYLYKKRYLALFQSAVDSMGSLLIKPRKAPLPGQVRSILVSRADHLGDVFIASSVLPHLRKAFPSAKIGFLAGSWASCLLESNPNIDKIISYDSARHDRSGRSRLLKALKGFKEAARVIKALRRDPYDLALDLRTYPGNTIPLLYLGAVRHIAGFSTGGFGFLLNREIEYREGVHEAAHLTDALRAIGIKKELEALKPGLKIPEESRRQARRTLEALGIENNTPFVLIHTGAGTPRKLWSREKWQRLIDCLGQGRREVLVFDNIYGSLERCVKLQPGLSLEQFSAICERAALFIGLDSFPAHLAASFDIPVIVIWCGINDPARWKPLSSRVKIIKRDMACAPCEKSEGCQSMECMDATVEEVMAGAASFGQI